MANARKIETNETKKKIPLGARLMGAYDGTFKVVGKGVGHVSALPVVGYVTSIPMRALRGIVIGHDETLVRALTKKTLKNPEKVAAYARRIFSADQMQMLNDAANQEEGTTREEK